MNLRAIAGLAVLGVVIALVPAGCSQTPGPDPANSGQTPWVPRPPFRDGAMIRAAASVLGSEIGEVDVAAEHSAPASVGAHFAVCGVRLDSEVDNGGYMNSWRRGDLVVEQVVLAHPDPYDGARILTDVAGSFGCMEYDDRDGKHRLIGNPEDFPVEQSGITRSFLYCEVLPSPPRPLSYACSVFLAREDLVVRVTAFTPSEATARQAATSVGKRAASQLASAW